MRQLQSLLIGSFMLLLCLANVYLMHRHQHLVETVHEKDNQLKGLRKENNDLEFRQSKPGPTSGTVNLPPAPPPAPPTALQPPAQGAQAGSEMSDNLKRQIADLQTQLGELSRLRNKSSTLENLNEDLEEKVEDLEKEVREKSNAIEFYVAQEKQASAASSAANPGQAAPAAAPGVKVRVGREKYQKVRDQLGLDDDIVITGSGGPPNCNLFCNTGGFVAGCPPTCVFKQPIIVPGAKATACIFNGHRLGDIPEDIREAGCIPVGEGMESEVNYKSLANHRVDPETWTRTYRRDADAPAPYYSPQEVRMRHPEATRPLKDRIKGAVAVISNCKPTERKEVIRILRQHIKVAFLGKCGDEKWPEDCVGKCSKFDVLTKHMVYLAFENSHTQDYATEKLYDGLSANSITVAFGAPNSVELAPRNSIINIASVQDADAVGKRLKAMLDDPELKEANQITQWHMNMAWRPEWEEKMSFTRLHSDCRLCETLRRRVVVATGSAWEGFGQLQQTVASVQKWERARPIMVFDMGLNEWQKDQVRAWAHCALVELGEYSRAKSWKLRVHALLFAVHAAGKALWLDAGFELTGRLAAIDVAMERHGLFLVQEARSVGDAVRPSALHDLGLPPDMARAQLPLLSAGVQGHSDAGLPYERVLVPVAQCVAQDSTCAAGGAPVNETSPTLPDQGVLSVVAQTSGTMVHAQDNAVIAFGNATVPGVLRRVEGGRGPAAMVFRTGACVHEVGKEADKLTVAYYAFRGNHKLKVAGGGALSVVHGRDLEACSTALKGDVTVRDHAKELVSDLMRWTMNGLVLQFDSDVPRNDMSAGQFVHIPQNRKATLLDCAKECWLNLACQAFSYDQELGECWPKTQGHETAAKAGVTSSNVDTAIRSSKKPEDWLALWGSRPPNAGKRSGL